MTEALLIFFSVGIILDHAHLLSPIGLAWSSARFRSHMRERWQKFLLVPALFVAVPVGIGLSVANTKAPAFQVVAATYVLWNLGHFGLQNYGVFCLLGWRKRWQTDLAIVGTIAPLIWLSLAGPVDLIWIALGISLAHWLTDITLCAKASGRWVVFGSAALIAGATGFIWKTTAIGGCGPMLAACSVVYSIPWLLGARYGLGFVHFLYSRWIWQHQGRELLAIVAR
jgi:hypothetical protein